MDLQLKHTCQRPYKDSIYSTFHKILRRMESSSLAKLEKETRIKNLVKQEKQKSEDAKNAIKIEKLDSSVIT